MNLSKQKVHLFLRLSVALAILGILCKIMHWPYAGTLLLSGILGIGVFYSMRFAQKPSKTLLDGAKLFLLLAFLTHYVVRVFHLSYGHWFTTIAQVAFVLFLILYVREVLFIDTHEEHTRSPKSKKRAISKGLSYPLYGTAALGIIPGAQFKILYWEFGWITGNILLIVGLLAAAESVLIGLKDT